MKRFLMLIAACAAFLGAQAQEGLFITPDAKSMGMGGVAMTTLSASHAIYENAAAAAFSNRKMQISGTYYSQTNYNYYVASGYYNFDSRNLVQAGWRQLRREPGNNDMTADAGYSRRINERWAVGVVARYHHLKRADQTADALSADLSAMYVLPLENLGRYTSLRVGAKLANLGGYLNNSNFSLPMNLTAGAALNTFITDAHEVTLGLDAGYYFSPSVVRGFEAAVGAEYKLMQLVSIRAGYHLGEKKTYYPNYGSVGAGVEFMHLRLDFAYIFADKETYLHNTYSLSFGFDF